MSCGEGACERRGKCAQNILCSGSGAVREQEPCDLCVLEAWQGVEEARVARQECTKVSRNKLGSTDGGAKGDNTALGCGERRVAYPDFAARGELKHTGRGNPCSIPQPGFGGVQAKVCPGEGIVLLAVVQLDRSGRRCEDVCIVKVREGVLPGSEISLQVSERGAEA